MTVSLAATSHSSTLLVDCPAGAAFPDFQVPDFAETDKGPSTTGTYSATCFLPLLCLSATKASACPLPLSPRYLEVCRFRPYLAPSNLEILGATRVRNHHPVAHLRDGEPQRASILPSVCLQSGPPSDSIPRQKRGPHPLEVNRIPLHIPIPPPALWSILQDGGRGGL